MILAPGSQILVAHRRLFDNDHSRMFVGVVEAYEDGLAVVSGHTWLYDPNDGCYRRKPDERVKVVAIASGTVIVYRLPATTDLGSFWIEADGQDVYARDDGEFRMDLSEGAIHDSVRRSA